MLMRHDYNGIEIHTKYSGIVIVKIQLYKTHSQHSIFVTPQFLYRIVFFKPKKKTVLQYDVEHSLEFNIIFRPL